MLRKYLTIFCIILASVSFSVAEAAKKASGKAVEYYQQGCTYERFGMLDKALESYELAIKADPTLNAAIFRLASIYDIKRDFKKSKELYKQIIANNESFYLAYNNLGIAEYRDGNPEEAIKNWKMSLKFNPTQADVFNNLGLAAIMQNKYDEAIKYFDRALDLKPLFLGASKNRGFALFKIGHYAEANNQLHKNALAFAYDPYSLYNYAEFSMNWHNYDTAVNFFEKALEKRNDIPDFYNAAALAYAYAGDFDSAEEKLSSSFELKGSAFGYEKAFGRVCQLKGDDDRALEHYLKAMKLNDKDPELAAWLGTLYADMKLENQAISLWSSSIAKIGFSEPVTLARAEYYISKGDYSSALNDVQSVLSKNPSEFNALYLKGEAYLKQGQTKQAMECFDLSLKACPYFNLSAEKLADIYGELGNFKRSTQILSEAIEKNPSSPSLYCSLGQIYLKMGNSAAAIQAWMDGLAMDGTYAPIYYNLGVVSLKGGDRAEAERYFNAYLRLEPEGEYVLDIKKALEN